MAEQTQARVVPVGAAFLEAHAQRPGLTLWNGDGIHASPVGDYLVAAVFAAALLHLDVASLAFDGGLAAEDGRFLRGVAARTVAREL